MPWEKVSIHAPGRGATSNSGLPIYSPSVSIHAPGRGATKIRSLSACETSVSIHAPGRGATGGGDDLGDINLRFNSRTREGCDVSAPYKSCYHYGFNSRTREGCDREVVIIIAESDVSIHAPGRGAT